MADMGNYQNLLALLQSGALGPGNGPIPAQNPQPGFRAPGTPGMAMPQQQQQTGITPQQGMGALSGALAQFKPPYSGTGGVNPSDYQAVFGNSGMGQPAGILNYSGGNMPDMANPTAATMPGGGGFFSFLKGLF